MVPTTQSEREVLEGRPRPDQKKKLSMNSSQLFPPDKWLYNVTQCSHNPPVLHFCLYVTSGTTSMISNLQAALVQDILREYVTTLCATQADSHKARYLLQRKAAAFHQVN
jgi:hypothetical protein